MCVSTHYSPLIPSNAVWSLEAGTLISCFFCFTNSLWRPGERISILEAEIRGGQKIAGGVENGISERQFLTCLQKDDEKGLAQSGVGAAWVSAPSVLRDIVKLLSADVAPYYPPNFPQALAYRVCYCKLKSLSEICFQCSFNLHLFYE